MRRGIVVQQRRKYTIVMEEDGRFHRAEPIKHVAIGAETFYRPKRAKKFQPFFFVKPLLEKRIRMVAMVLTVLLFTLPLYTWYDSDKVYAYVNIDINPSIEILLNKSMRVEEVVALNSDAEKLLNEPLEIKGQYVEAATDKIISKSLQLKMISNTKTVLIGINYLDGPTEDGKVTEVIDSYFTKNPKGNLKIATFEVPKEVREQARKKNISMNQLMASSLKDGQTTFENPDVIHSKMNQEEIALIQSYYTDDKEMEKTGDGQDSKDNTLEESEKKTLQDKQQEEKNQLPPGLENQKEKGQLPPGLKKHQEEKGQLPPGLEKQKEKGQLPPGLKKHQEKKGQLPPGLEKQKEKGQLPPGLEKHQEEKGQLPPGLEMQLSF